MEAAISVARVTASSLLWGFNFQFPLIKGLRAMSRADPADRETPNEGAKAEVDPTREKRDNAAANFMISLWKIGQKCGWLQVDTDVDQGGSKLAEER